MTIQLPDLPYAKDALAPHISARTLEFHHDKHHAAYVANTNKMIDGTDLAAKSLVEIMRAAAAAPDKKGLFNNSAQVWNHTFYWHSMKPKGGGQPTGKVADAIKKDFGDYEAFKKAFAEAGATQFGSGWAWLVVNKGKLEVRKTGNAETPITELGVTPLVTMDVWEHAYYLDFMNARPKYIETFLTELVNWDFANQNLSDAK